MLLKHLVTPLLLLLTALPGQAQRQRCGTPEPQPMPAGFQGAPSDCGYFTNSPEPQYEPSFFYDIPVVFHVIQNNGGDGFLSATTIQDQIDILNEDFQATPGSPGAPGTNGRIRFHLATTDPGGNPTTGITYTTNNSWYQDSGNYWSSLAWDTNRYLNIYTNSPPCCYGYVSGFPSEGIAGQDDDRVVVWWEAVGRLPTAGWPLNMGRTATHEVGHYLGLYHTFCGGCGTSACYTTGDLICDTNRQSNPTSGCPSSPNSCGSPDPFHNYMDYTDDPCLWEFTPEQVNRMRCTLEHWRPNLFELVPGVEVCFGTGCPCANDDAEAGCANSTGSGGRLEGSGTTSVLADDLQLVAYQLPPTNSGLFYMGDALVQNVFFDGFQCALGTTFRYLCCIQDTGAGGTMALDNPAANSGGLVQAGTTWIFQGWHRDLPGTPCGTGANLTNAYSVTFSP